MDESRFPSWRVVSDPLLLVSSGQVTDTRNGDLPIFFSLQSRGELE
jgi:hypothetical protein